MLKTRILTALILLGLFLPALFFLPVLVWAGLMLLLTLVGVWEWSGFLQLGRMPTQGLLALTALIEAGWLFGLQQQGLHWFFYHTLTVSAWATAFWLLVVPVALYRNRFLTHPLLNALLGMGLMLSLWMALVTVQALNPCVLLILMATIWLADSAAYFAGKQWGRHKLAPAISPGKTWEGVAGALVAVGLFALLLKSLSVVNSWWVLPGLWLVTVVGIYGDLFESFFKRRAGLKDSGQFLPGHGGLLDRIDGVMPALPVGLCVLYWAHFVQQGYTF